MIGSRFHSDEEFVPFAMFAGGDGAASRECLIEEFEIGNLIHLHQDPVGKGAAAGARDLIPQQLDRAVEDSVIVRLKNAIFAVMAQPNHAFVFDSFHEQWMRFEWQHLYSFWVVSKARGGGRSRRERSWQHCLRSCLRSVLRCVMGKDQVAGLGLIVAGETGFH
jgi:hypothetical protein